MFIFSKKQLLETTSKKVGLVEAQADSKSCSFYRIYQKNKSNLKGILL